MNGDTFRIPASQTFQCILKWRHLHEKHEKHASQPSQSQTQSYKDLGRFLITSHCLGSGSYATVQLALDTTGHQQAACKIIRRKEGNDLRKEMKEATLLMNLHHPNINRVYAVDLDPEFLYIILELCTGGDLFTYITTHSKHRLCEGEAKYIMYQLLKGLKYLHDRMISHRDLKVKPYACFKLLTSFCHNSQKTFYFSHLDLTRASRSPTSVLHVQKLTKKLCMFVAPYLISRQKVSWRLSTNILATLACQLTAGAQA